MKQNKSKWYSWVLQLGCVGSAAAICFGIYQWWNLNNKACFALSIGAGIFLIYCFYNTIFKSKGMQVYILSGVSVLIFANKLYEYERIKRVFPFLKNVDPLYFVLASIGGVFFIFILMKALSNFYENNDRDLENVENADNIETTGNVGITEKRKYDDKRNGKVYLGMYLVLLIVLIAGGAVVFEVWYINGGIHQEDDFFAVIISLLKYAGSAVIILLSIVVVIIFLIEMIRIIISRMKRLFSSLKKEKKEDAVPLCALSILIDIIMFYLAYKTTGITTDTFYDLVSNSEYFALPLIMLFFSIVFVIFLRLTHATLVLMMEMQPDNIKNLLGKINDKAKITERIEQILKMIIDIVLDSIIVVLQFAEAIPSFFYSAYSLVMMDEDEFELEDRTEENPSENNE